MASRTPAEPEGWWDDRGANTERLVFFSDAVFAIAMTLLIIDIHVPEAATQQELWDRLLQLWPNMLGFVISFFVISAYWRIHHQMFRFIKRYDRTLIILNFMLLFLVVLLPFTTSLISLYGNWQLPVVIYDGCLALAGLVIGGIWMYATFGNRLVDADLDRRHVRWFRFQALYASLVFLLIIALTFVIPSAYAQFAILVLRPLQRLPFLRRRVVGEAKRPRM